MPGFNISYSLEGHLSTSQNLSEIKVLAVVSPADALSLF